MIYVARPSDALLGQGGNPEAIVDLHDVHTVPRELLDEQIRLGHRKARCRC